MTLRAVHTDDEIKAMTDDELIALVCDADAPHGERVKAQWERQRRDVEAYDDPYGLVVLDDDWRPPGGAGLVWGCIFSLCIWAALALLGGMVYSLFT